MGQRDRMAAGVGILVVVLSVASFAALAAAGWPLVLLLGSPPLVVIGIFCGKVFSSGSTKEESGKEGLGCAGLASDVAPSRPSFQELLHRIGWGEYRRSETSKWWKRRRKWAIDLNRPGSPEVARELSLISALDAAETRGIILG